MTMASNRSLRAVDEYMTVLQSAPDLYSVVSQSGREYVVDLREIPACTCPDFQYRPDEGGCKHILRAQLQTGRADVGDLKQALERAATAAEAEAERLERESDESRRRAWRLRRAVQKANELIEVSRTRSGDER